MDEPAQEQQSIDFRGRAQEYLDSAQAHIRSGETAHLRYAALDLRMAIESLSYDVFEAYSDEVSDDAMKVWQPRKVLEELAEIDPFSKVSWTLSVELPDGEKVVGTEEKLDIRWAYDKHNTLGSYLHERTYDQIRRGSEVDPERLGILCREVADRVVVILASEVARLKMDVFLSFECEVCRHKIPVRTSKLRDFVSVRCKGCRSIYDKVENEQIKVKLRRAYWTCSKGHYNATPAHQLTAEKELKCETCREKQIVKRATLIGPLADKDKVVDVSPLERSEGSLENSIPADREDDRTAILPVQVGQIGDPDQQASTRET